MKEMGGHVEEIQTNTAMFASQIHKKKEGGNCKHRYANSHTEPSGSLSFPRLCCRITLRDISPPCGDTQWECGWSGRVVSALSEV
jgi:hypothetical protein